jgi:hypothetical protein
MEDFKKEQKSKRADRKRRSVSFRRRQTVSGDYRTERSRWPSLRRVGFGVVNGCVTGTNIPMVRRARDDVVCGETIKLGGRELKNVDSDVGNIVATIKIDQDRYAVLDTDTLKKPFQGNTCGQLFFLLYFLCLWFELTVIVSLSI